MRVPQETLERLKAMLTGYSYMTAEERESELREYLKRKAAEAPQGKKSEDPAASPTVKAS